MTKDDKLGIVSELFIYPVKSLPGIPVTDAVLHSTGLAMSSNPLVADRKWMLVDENGSFLTQRQLPKMALIKLSVEGNYLVMSAPGKWFKARVAIDLDASKCERIACRVWGSAIDGFVVSDAGTSKWLSDFLERSVRMVCFLQPESMQTRSVVESKASGCEATEDDAVVYSDYSPFMLISQASLDELNTRLERKVDIRHFRPNIVNTGCLAYAEDKWNRFKIGDAHFCKIKHCTRCLLTTVWPDKGIKDPSQEPLKTLKDYRMDKEKYGTSPMFGICLTTCDKGLTIRVGDIIKDVSVDDSAIEVD